MNFSPFLKTQLISNVDWLAVGFVQQSFEYFQDWILLYDPVPLLEGFSPLMLKPQIPFLQLIPLPTLREIFLHLLGWGAENSI